MFNKTCKKCQNPFQSSSRNSQNCESCKWKYEPKKAESQFLLDRFKLSDRSLVSYIVGFCCADGTLSLNKNGRAHYLKYMSTDTQIVDDITAALGYNRVRNINREHPDHRKTVWENILYSDNAQYFLERGLKKNKEDLDYSEMDVDLYPFLRGLCDGDGSIAEDKVTFLARRRLLESLRKPLGERGYEVHRIGRGKSPVNFVIEFGSTRAKGLLQEMYNDGGPCLHRKKGAGCCSAG